MTQEYPPGYVGGIGTQSRVKALGLADLGHDVEVLTAGQETGPQLVARSDGPVRVNELRTPGGDFDLYRTETYWLGYSWAVLGALRTLTATRSYDVIDFPDYGAEGLAFQLDRLDDDLTAVVVHLHGSLQMFAERIGWPAPDEALHRVGTFMEGSSIAAADRLLAASRSIAKFTASRAEIPPEEIDVVLGAVDADVFVPELLADNQPATFGAGRPVRLLFVGNLTENKGLHTVFDAFMRLAPSDPSLKLRVAGAGDEQIAQEMCAEAAAAGIGDRLEFLGFVEHEHLPALYRTSDLLVVPSQFEGGLGMVYLEAMACGVPVIATSSGGAAEAILDKETGMLLKRGDVEETIGAIKTLLEHPQQLAAMGVAARAHVERQFSPRPYAERVAACYERAINRRRSVVLT